MPNRILKESICTSEDINGLTWFEEVLFYRLIVNCDDYGRMDARPAILKAKLFPLKDRIALRDIQHALVKLADTGCLVLYQVKNRPYLYLPTWEVHQRIRTKKSKYPGPEQEDLQTNDSNSPQIAADCSNLQQVAADCGLNPNPIQSESKSESESNILSGNPTVCKDVLDYLNAHLGTRYRPNVEKNIRLIHARMAEGFTLEDFKQVIDHKSKEWKGTEWEKFLRPETLFGPKFEGYLNASLQKESQKNQDVKDVYDLL